MSRGMNLNSFGETDSSTLATSASGTIVVDAHHHLWDPEHHDFSWMTGTAASLARPYNLRDLEDAISHLPIVATIVVQATNEISETHELLTAARESNGLVRGVVGWVNLQTPNVSDQLDQLHSSTDSEFLVGIRHLAQDEPDVNWLQRPQVIEGVRNVQKHGLVYELLVRKPQRRAAIELARHADDGYLVLDHAGKPEIELGEFESWRNEMAELAALEHVSCKLSGLVTEAGQDWNTKQLGRYFETVIELFGPQRCLFGSDWPVCTIVASYGDVYESANSLLSSLLTSEEKIQVFSRNATEIYSLDSYQKNT